MKKRLLLALLTAILLGIVFLPSLLAASPSDPAETVIQTTEPTNTLLPPDTTQPDSLEDLGSVRQHDFIFGKADQRKISYPLSFQTPFPYDYVVIHLTADENLTLTSDKTVVIPHNQREYTLHFSINNLSTPDPADYESAVFDRIHVKIEFVNNGKSIQSVMGDILVISSSSGILVSDNRFSEQTLFTDFVNTCKFFNNNVE